MTQNAQSGERLDVAAFYHFTRFADPAALRAPLEAVCNAGGVKGTILLAPEGFNGTIAGTPAAVRAVIDHLVGLAGDARLELKFSHADTPPFLRMKVRIKREIVTLGVDGLDPVDGVGTYLAPAAWNALIAEPDVVLIDTRNDYEVQIGSFDGAIDPATHSFRAFPGWFETLAAELRTRPTPPKIAMFCTGGIRCEKATALVKAAGFDEVFHLKGGILKYLETMPADQSRWHGDCFVFDARVAVGHGLVQGDYELCHACRMPLSPADRASPAFEAGVACPKCHDARSADQRARYAERERQMAKAAAAGVVHLGPATG